MLHRILDDQAKRARLLNDIVKVIEREHFAGVNIDFEELAEPSDEVLVRQDPYDRPLDVVFVDGGHGFPVPMIDWFYGAGRLRRGPDRRTT